MKGLISLAYAFYVINFLTISSASDITGAEEGIMGQYVAMRKEVTLEEADKLCLKESMELATIDSRDEEKMLEEELDKVWGKFNKSAGKENGFWISGDYVSYTKWALNEPNNVQNETDDDCVEVFKDPGTGNYFWNDVTCDSKRSFVCYRDDNEWSHYSYF